MTPEAMDAFQAQLEALGWSFTMHGPDGIHLNVIVGDTPDGLTQHDVWNFIRGELHPRLRLAAVRTSGTRQ